MHTFARVKPHFGWTATAPKVKLAKPVKQGDTTITEAVATITRTADPGVSIKPGTFDEFEFSAGKRARSGRRRGRRGIRRPGSRTPAQGLAVRLTIVAPPQTTRSLLSRALAAGTALTFAIGAALVTSVIIAAPATAHATLIKITPAASAQLTSAPKEVVVDFDEPVNTTFATVVVTNSAGVSVAQGQPVVLGAKVTQTLSSGLTSGDFRIVFRVTSSDGHPVTGESRFTLSLAPGVAPTTPPGPPSATPSGPAEATPNGAVGATPNGPVAGTLSANPQDGFLTRFLVPIAGAVGLLVLGAGLLLWERQRR